MPPLGTGTRPKRCDGALWRELAAVFEANSRRRAPSSIAPGLRREFASPAEVKSRQSSDRGRRPELCAALVSLFETKSTRSAPGVANARFPLPSPAEVRACLATAREVSPNRAEALDTCRIERRSRSAEIPLNDNGRLLRRPCRCTTLVV